jgi:5-oxoprolinase (ATP-hydrolysing) subunit B
VAARPKWCFVGDRALLRTFPGSDIVAANASALACRERLRALGSNEIEDIIPGARTVLVVFRAGAEPPADVIEILERDEEGGAGIVETRTHEISVRYGGEDGPDLAELARAAEVGEADVVAIHAAPTYIVGFIGFSPGFPYLLGLDPRLATPRLESPRVRVPAGSVGIGGPYTGVYPSATPGGWRVIGRTDVELFDPMRDPPSLLAPGDRVRFVAR